MPSISTPGRSASFSRVLHGTDHHIQFAHPYQIFCFLTNEKPNTQTVNNFDAPKGLDLNSQSLSSETPYIQLMLK